MIHIKTTYDNSGIDTMIGYFRLCVSGLTKACAASRPGLLDPVPVPDVTAA